MSLVQWTFRKIRLVPLLAVVGAASLPGAAHARPVHFDFTLSGPATPSAENPCVVNVFQAGRAVSPELGEFDWVGNAVDHVCTRGLGQGDAVALSTFTDPANKANTIIAIYHTTITVPDLQNHPTVLKWKGTWEFVGGTGKYAGIRGRGEIPEEPLQDVSGTYKCRFEGRYQL